MSEQSRRWTGPPSYVALCLADAMRWLGWRLLTLLVEWGAVMCALRAAADWTADVPRPRVLRHEVSLRREIDRGLAQIDAYVAATGSPDDGTQPSDGRVRRLRRGGA